MPATYIIYAHFEALNVALEGAAMNPNGSNTRQIAKQKPCSFCYVVVRCDCLTYKPVLYRGENAVDEFLRRLCNEVGNIQ